MVAGNGRATDVVLGVLAVVLGIALAARGYLAVRLVIPIWGAFQGFVIGAGLVAANTDDGFLEGLLAWVVGLVVALAYGYLAYAYYVAAACVRSTRARGGGWRSSRSSSPERSSSWPTSAGGR